MNRNSPTAANALGCSRLTRLSGIIACAALLFLVGQATRPAQAKDEPSAPFTATLDVRVTFDNKPVAGAQVVAIDVDNRVRAVTDRDGKAQIRLAPDGKLNCIVALDSKLGLGGRWFGFTRKVPTTPGMLLELSLAPAEPHTIRVVDDEGNPVRLASIAVAGIATEGDWLKTDVLEAANLHTDS
jgi:hypothetical protein